MCVALKLSVSNNRPASQSWKVGTPFLQLEEDTHQCHPRLFIYLPSIQPTSDLRKHIPVGEGNVTVRRPLVGGGVVLYTDWHYLHLLLRSKDRATKYTL